MWAAAEYGPIIVVMWIMESNLHSIFLLDSDIPHTENAAGYKLR